MEQQRSTAKYMSLLHEEELCESREKCFAIIAGLLLLALAISAIFHG